MLKKNILLVGLLCSLIAPNAMAVYRLSVWELGIKALLDVVALSAATGTLIAEQATVATNNNADCRKDKDCEDSVHNVREAAPAMTSLAVLSVLADSAALAATGGAFLARLLAITREGETENTLHTVSLAFFWASFPLSFSGLLWGSAEWLTDTIVFASNVAEAPDPMQVGLSATWLCSFAAPTAIAFTVPLLAYQLISFTRSRIGAAAPAPAPSPA